VRRAPFTSVRNLHEKPLFLRSPRELTARTLQYLLSNDRGDAQLLRKAAIFSLRNFLSAGLAPAPAG
jgi:hypothetical protein